MSGDVFRMEHQWAARTGHVSFFPKCSREPFQMTIYPMRNQRILQPHKSYECKCCAQMAPSSKLHCSYAYLISHSDCMGEDEWDNIDSREDSRQAQANDKILHAGHVEKPVSVLAVLFCLHISS